MLSINNAVKIIGPYKYLAAVDVRWIFFQYQYIALIKNI